MGRPATSRPTPSPAPPGLNGATRRVRRGPKHPLKPWQVLCAIAVLVGLWWLAAALIGSPLILPTPWQVFIRWCELALTVDFWITTGVSLLRILIGFAAGMIVGVALATAMRQAPVVRALFAPIIAVVRATPVVSFIIIALIFIQTPYLPSCISFLMVLPLAWENTDKGLAAIDYGLLEMAEVYRLGFGRKVRLIYGPALRPYLLSAAIACMGLAWKSGVTAEVIASPVWAIGRQLDEAKIYLQTPDLFAWTLTLVLVSLLLEWLLKTLVRRFGPAQGAVSDKRRLAS